MKKRLLRFPIPTSILLVISFASIPAQALPKDEDSFSPEWPKILGLGVKLKIIRERTTPQFNGTLHFRQPRKLYRELKIDYGFGWGSGKGFKISFTPSDYEEKSYGLRLDHLAIRNPQTVPHFGDSPFQSKIIYLSWPKRRILKDRKLSSIP